MIYSEEQPNPPSTLYVFNETVTGLSTGTQYRAVIEKKPAGGIWALDATESWTQQ